MKPVLILLAAGESRRFHGNKLLSYVHGKPMYRSIIDELNQFPDNFFEKKIVVTQYQEIMDTLTQEGYRIIENQNIELGISHSIRLGIEAAGEDAEAFCFAVCDQPYLRGRTIIGFLREWQRSGKGLGCLSFRGEFGNPAVFACGYRKELAALEGDVGGRSILRKHLDDLYLYEVKDEKELVDIDVRQ